MRLVIVRHGDPDYDLDCLTEKGRKQAKVAAQRLLEEGIETIYSSPLGRAVQTARAFSEASGIKDVSILEFMKEIRYGLEDNLYDDEWNPWDAANRMAEEGCDLQDPEWKAHRLFKENTATVDVEKIAAASDEWFASLGYKREGLYYRNTRKDDREDTIALFCHGGSSTALLSRVFNVQFPLLCGVMHLPCTGITIIRFDSTPGSISVPVLELANDGRHIRGLE